MHKIFHPSGLCKWTESTTTPKTWPDWKSPFALSYILCVCYGGYQVCSAWTLHTQVLLIFKIHSVCKCHILYSIELRRPSTQNKDDFLEITKQDLERGARLSLHLGGEYCDHIETPIRQETEPKSGGVGGRGWFHNSAPFSHESCITSFCHHLPKHHFLSQSHILAQIFFTKLSYFPGSSHTHILLTVPESSWFKCSVQQDPQKALWVSG